MVDSSNSELDSVFSALSDGTRRAIVEQLARGEATVGELAHPHDMSMQAISKHLAKLERSGLIVRRRKGREVYCSLIAPPIQSAVTWLEEQHRFWDARLDRLGELVEFSGKRRPTAGSDADVNRTQKQTP